MATIGITDLAHSIRKASAEMGTPIPLSYGQQLIAAVLGHPTLASYQAAQANSQEPKVLDFVQHVILDCSTLFARADELQIGMPKPMLRSLTVAAFKERLPRARLHSLASDFVDHLHEWVEIRLLNDGMVSSASADANYDGIQGAEFEIEVDLDQVSVGEPAGIDLEGQVILGIDTERPYSGHKVNFEANLTLTRCGRCCFEAPAIDVERASLDDSYAFPDRVHTPPPSLAEALAEKLNITPAEAEELVNVEPQPLTGHSGEMVYGYELDFTAHASPELAEKLLANHGSMNLKVEPNFFDQYGFPWVG